jgi:hypothetical protein
MRKSTVTTESDQAGPFEIELFDTKLPKSVIICSHGMGVRRWDGERFFYAVAQHYGDHAVLLADQVQVLEDGGCKLNSFDIMVSRVQRLAALAKEKHPGVPVVVMGHSMGCAVASQLDLSGVDKVIFVAPAAGDIYPRLVKQYGPDIANGKLVKSTDGLTKLLSKEYIDSVKGVVREREYQKMLQHYNQVYVFEAGDEEIVGDERLAHRDMPFAGYKIIPGAKHNVAGEPLRKLFVEIDRLV